MEIIKEFIEALDCEIEALKRGQGTNIVTIYNGKFLNRISDFHIYQFNLENFLTVLDDTPALIEINSREYECEIISVNGQQVQLTLKGKLSEFIPIAKIKINTWYLLEILKKKYEENLENSKRFENSYKLFSGSYGKIEKRNFTFPYSDSDKNGIDKSQTRAIISSLNSSLCIIWGPPGTGKTRTISKAIEAHLNLGRKVLLLSHSNNAVDQALEKVVKQTKDSYYKECQLVRLGTPKTDILKDFDLVLVDKIIEHKSAELIHQKNQLSTSLKEVKSELQSYERMLQQWDKIQNLNIAINKLYSKYKTVESQCKSLKKNTHALKIKIDEQNIKLEKAKKTGIIKRILLGLNPDKLNKNTIELTSQLNIVDNQINKLENILIEIRKVVIQKNKTKEKYILDIKRKLNTDKDIDEIKQKINKLTNLQKSLLSKIEKIDKKIEELKTSIFFDAKLVATTLTKSYIAKEIEKIDFDILIVDEVSMAPLPMLFWAASKAKKGVTIVGDFKQLPPISITDEEIAQKWLKRNIFNVLGLDNVSKASSDRVVNLLKWQYRMNPLISEIPRTRIYENKLEDANGTENKVVYDEISENKPICLIDTTPHNPWCSQLDSGRFNLISALICVSLAERILKSLQDEKSTIGIITPYRNQARLILKIAEDKRLLESSNLRINTVHSFQGGEETIIIFDCVEGLGAKRWSIINEFNNGETAKLLLNVALTRAEKKLYLVANKYFLKEVFPKNSLLIDILCYFEQKGSVKESTDLLNNFKEENFEYWIEKINSLDNRPLNETMTFSEMEFWPAFINDLAHIKNELIIFSPYVTTIRVGKLQNYIVELVSKGMKIAIITSPPNQQPKIMRVDALKALRRLKSLGVMVKFRDNMHEKIALMDRKIKWVGSLNILSHNKRQEYMERFVGENTVKELYGKYDLENFLSDSNLVGNQCPIHNCGGFIIIKKQRKKPHMKFYGCTNYPICTWVQDIEEKYSYRRYRNKKQNN